MDMTHTPHKPYVAFKRNLAVRLYTYHIPPPTYPMGGLPTPGGYPMEHPPHVPATRVWGGVRDEGYDLSMEVGV